MINPFDIAVVRVVIRVVPVVCFLGGLAAAWARGGWSRSLANTPLGCLRFAVSCCLPFGIYLCAFGFMETTVQLRWVAATYGLLISPALMTCIASYGLVRYLRLSAPLMVLLGTFILVASFLFEFGLGLAFASANGDIA